MKVDDQLQAAVIAELVGDARFAASDISVAVRDGVVTLGGQVENLPARFAAAHAAEHVPGVRALANNIVVRLPMDRVRTDVDIAHDAVDALMWDTDVPDKTIKVRVQDGWIWLLGHADEEHQRAAAERAVRDIRGVKGVTVLVRLTNSAAHPSR